MTVARLVLFTRASNGEDIYVNPDHVNKVRQWDDHEDMGGGAYAIPHHRRNWTPAQDVPCAVLMFDNAPREIVNEWPSDAVRWLLEGGVAER